MNRTITVGLGAMALAGTTVASFGADLGVPPAPAAPAPVLYSWSGFYIGGNVGGKWDDFRGNAIIAPVAGVTPGGVLAFGNNLFGSNNSSTSFVGGGQIGYNWQVGWWVLGLEGDIDGTSLQRTFVAPATVALPFVPGDTITLKNDWQASIRARVGYAWDRVLFYGTGGVAFANIQAGVNFTPFAGLPGLIATGNSKTVVGVTVGGGIEYGFWDNWSLAGEYRFSAFENENFAQGNLPITAVALAPLTSSARLSTNEVTARINYRFNWGSPY